MLLAWTCTPQARWLPFKRVWNRSDLTISRLVCTLHRTSASTIGYRWQPHRQLAPSLTHQIRVEPTNVMSLNQDSFSVRAAKFGRGDTELEWPYPTDECCAFDFLFLNTLVDRTAHPTGMWLLHGFGSLRSKGCPGGGEAIFSWPSWAGLRMLG